MNRVVITGMGAISGLGHDVATLVEGLKQGKSAIQAMAGWEVYRGLQSLIGGPAEINDIMNIPRKARRSMGRLSIFAVQAAQQALLDAKVPPDLVSSGRLGCVIGSTMGSAESLTEAFEIMLPERDLSMLSSMKFFQCVSHTAAMNVAQFLGITGVVMATSAACASGLQAVGAGMDLIRLGKQDVVLCGGAEELHPTVTGSFDVLFATSTHYNQTPQCSPRPFDRDRDGLVCGEGAGIVVLESRAHAEARKAPIYGEILGFDTCGSGVHVSQSNRDSMVQCMQHALRDAGVQAKDIDYVNAHATATLQGDKEEAEAIEMVFGDRVPVSSLKGHLGHTLGASGALELIASLAMMADSQILPTRNLEVVAPDCRGIWHVQEPISKEINLIVKNCFAFGGINAGLVCSKP